MQNNEQTTLAEMALHTPLSLLEDPQAVLIIGCLDQALYRSIVAAHEERPQVSFAATLAEVKEGGFDVIVDLRSTVTLLSEAQALIQKLSDRGVIVRAFSGVVSGDHLAPFNTVRYVMPYGFSSLVPNPKSINGFVFASKKHHPTADLRLQKVDMLEGCSYYSTDIHEAAFALPTALYTQLRNHLKL